MKKISFLATALLLTAGMSLTGCKEDTQPRLDNPTEFVLNTPPMADQLYIFRADDANNSLNDITFTVSQPNYGMGVVTTYQVQVAKSEADFQAWDAAENKTGDVADDNAITGSDGLPLVNTIAQSFTNAVITVAGNDFCDAVNAVYGHTRDNYTGEPVSVAVRVHAWVLNAPQSSIFSNVIVLPKVSTYIPISEKGKLYLIGQPSGWDINNGEMYCEETAIGSKIYYGIFAVNAGEFQFRFYSELGNWETNSIGAQDEDNPVDISFDDEGVYNGAVYQYGVNATLGKGSWQDASWAGGMVEVTINLNDMTIKMQKSEGKKLYVIGACSGWDINNDKMYVTETEPGSNIYKASLDINAGEFQFRFYSELGDWENNSIGSQQDDAPIDVAVNGNPYDVVVGGKGSWQCADWAGGVCNVTLDLNNNKVTFEKGE